MFNIEAYYKLLRTKKLGQLCRYFDKVDSTIDVAEKEDYDTLVVAREQTRGRGQRTNKWTSPNGCAMASVRIECPKASLLAQRLSFVQHIIAMSAAWTMEKIDPDHLGQEQIGLKWPNDIIYKPESQKIGGILVKTIDQPNHYDMTLSFGINVSNREPTTCLEQIVSKERGVKPDIPVHLVIAEIMNKLEEYTHDLTDEKFQHVKAEYEKRCLQVNTVVLDAEHGAILVKGVNDEGYLVGEDIKTGELRTVTRII